MLAVVKAPHIEIRGDAIPQKFITVVRKFFGADAVDVIVEEPGDDDIIMPETSKWFQETSASITPGAAMKVYREIHGLTQEALGKNLGGVARQEISKMERGKRAISKMTAKKLSKLFNVSVERFI